MLTHPPIFIYSKKFIFLTSVPLHTAIKITNAQNFPRIKCDKNLFMQKILSSEKKLKLLRFIGMKLMAFIAKKIC